MPHIVSILFPDDIVGVDSTSRYLRHFTDMSC